MAIFNNEIILRFNKSELKLSEGMMIALKELIFETYDSAFLKRPVFIFIIFYLVSNL